MTSTKRTSLRPHCFLAYFNYCYLKKEKRCYSTCAHGRVTCTGDGCAEFECGENEYQCTSEHEKCIPEIFMCDGINDCNGGEDERECGEGQQGEKEKGQRAEGEAERRLGPLLLALAKIH